MTDERIRILAVAPYESMKNALLHAAEGFPGLDLTVRIGDLEEGATIVRALTPEEAFDAIVSRGGTAGLIRKITEIPVIEIAVTVYDVLRTIRLAETYSGRCSIVGFPGVTEPAHLLSDLLRYRYDILTVRSEAEARETLLRLRNLASQAVVCDAVTHRIARELGFSAFLIASGEESLHEALREALEIGGVFHRMRRENAFQRLLLSGEAASIIVLNERGQILRATPREPSDALLSAMRRHMRPLRPSQEQRFYHRESDELHEIACRREVFEGDTIFLFRDQPSRLPIRVGRTGITTLDAEECRELFTASFYSISGAMGELSERISTLIRSGQPLLLLGESGTGKEQIARALYLASDLTRRPFTVVDCSLLDERSWDFLFTHHTSPLSGRDAVIYFKHLESLPEDRYPALRSAVQETNLVRRVRLIFSYTVDEGQSLSPAARAFASGIGCLPLPLPTLRSRKDEIPSLAGLYLSSLSPALEHPVAGFDPGALELLIRYEWPANYTQFKLVLETLAAEAGAAYITYSACYEALRRERRVYRKKPDAEGDLPWRGRSLSEIEEDVFLRVLADCGGSRTEAARILGISRTTLWRALSARSDREA